MNDKLIKNIMLHIKYPYTAIVIATMWIGLVSIINKQADNIELLVILTSIVTVIIAILGFRTAK